MLRCSVGRSCTGSSPSCCAPTGRGDRTAMQRSGEGMGGAQDCAPMQRLPSMQPCVAEVTLSGRSGPAARPATNRHLVGPVEHHTAQIAGGGQCNTQGLMPPGMLPLHAPPLHASPARAPCMPPLPGMVLVFLSAMTHQPRPICPRGSECMDMWTCGHVGMWAWSCLVAWWRGDMFAWPRLAMWACTHGVGTHPCRAMPDEALHGGSGGPA